MKPEQEKHRPGLIGSIFLKLRNYFTTGLLVMAPTMVTVWVLIQGFRIFDGILGQLYDKYIFAEYELEAPPGLGAVTLTFLIIFAGMVARNYGGRKLFAVWDRTINHVPLLNRVYIAVRQLADSFAKGGGIIFQYPVFVEYPRRGMYSIGFLTRRCDGPFCRIVGRQISSVFIPTTPNPTSGVLVFIPQEEIVPLDMTVEDAMKLIISGGTVTPDIKLPVIRSIS